MRRDVEFKSKGVTCRGWFYTPDKGEGPFPVVIMAGGWCYVKEIVMPHYAEFIIDEGAAVLIFDYRGFGGSDGEPRQHVDPNMQIEDYKSAIDFVQTLSEVDPDRVGVWGISYSGGHVLIVGATDPRVKCIVSNVAVIDGYVNMKRVHGELQYSRLLQTIMEDRKKRFNDDSKRGYIPMSAMDPIKTLCTWPFPDVYEIFNNIKKTEAPSHEHRNTIESAELLLSYTVFPFLKRILNIPTLMVVAEGDDHTPWDLDLEAYNQILTATKKLAVLPRISHMSLYSIRRNLEIAGNEGASWIKEHLIKVK
jgi:cephalosporin-C deacetylase-like acetyl esterase